LSEETFFARANRELSHRFLWLAGSAVSEPSSYGIAVRCGDRLLDRLVPKLLRQHGREAGPCAETVPIGVYVLRKPETFLRAHMCCDTRRQARHYLVAPPTCVLNPLPFGQSQIWLADFCKTPND